MPLSRPFVASLVLALALPGAAAAQMTGMAPPAGTFKPGPGPDELWEMTIKMEMEGMPMAMPAQTSQVCMKKGRKEADHVPTSDECTMTDLKASGNRTTFSMVCRGDPPMSGTGEVTSTPTSTNGRITVRSTKRGEEMTMTQTFSSRKIGTCTDTSEEYAAKMEADGKARLAKTCAEGIDLLQPALFDAKSACAPQRKQFCDRAASVASEMREPAGHAAMRRKYPAHLQAAFQLCGQDYAAVTKAACGKGVETRNWNFIGGGACDTDVRAHAPTYCNTGPNRSPDPQYFALCSRYVTITRGTATEGATPATAKPTAIAEPPKPDPVKQGVDAVRRLLPF